MDRQTDRIVKASTALAMRALRRAVKTVNDTSPHTMWQQKPTTRVI